MELFARVENVLKRRSKLKNTIEIDGCRIDLTGHKVFEEGQEIQLKPMEYDLFLFLCRNRNVAFTRNQLLDRIWGGDYEGETRTVDVHVASLRKKLKAASRIQTIPKLGYRLEV
nr:response regulator transcription factor [[Clostridium] symbiosum]